ncbi:hypothetical protein FA15DRAFT_602712 [Coprinopsis marcescibilis]|uniref:HAT C-terminal dimerisation domain-containing protein n=1 Tax=Coprinopsis marcescibilis TaxID=230819 RepID=A0A5C3KFA7_COPMA|nr:hypothetical protein FA15DRAFT_602712 [Coprinopsis marcescibilis]
MFLGDRKLSSRDVPHRSKITSMILDGYTKEYHHMRAELQSSVGWISYTTDLWTDPNLNPFMAVTAHYYIETTNGNIEYRSGLVAFHHTPGSHSGECLFQHLFKIIDDLGVICKV